MRDHQSAVQVTKVIGLAVLLATIFLMVIGIGLIVICFVLDIVACGWGKRDFGLTDGMLSPVIEPLKLFLLEHWRPSLVIAGVGGLLGWVLRCAGTARYGGSVSSSYSSSSSCPMESHGDAATCPKCGNPMSWTGGELNCQVERYYCSHCLF